MFIGTQKIFRESKEGFLTRKCLVDIYNIEFAFNRSL